jgi:hypothetical protein
MKLSGAGTGAGAGAEINIFGSTTQHCWKCTNLTAFLVGVFLLRLDCIDMGMQTPIIHKNLPEKREAWLKKGIGLKGTGSQDRLSKSFT